jgi:Trk K+ transport system NAD-binding subunit
MNQHYILCGLGKIGSRVLEQLRTIGARVVVVDISDHTNDPQLAGVPVVVGDCRLTETLQRAGIEQARGVLILTSDDLVNLSATLMVRHLNPAVRVIVRLFNQNLIARLGSAVENVFALSTSALAGPLLALIARTGEALGSFKLEDGRRGQVADFTVAPGSPVVGRDLADVVAAHQAVVIAFRPAGGAIRFLHEAAGPATLKVGDRAVVCGDPQALAPILAKGENESLPELLWAGFVRRFSRVALRTLSQVDMSVKVCSAVLLAVIAISVIVFQFGMGQNNAVDAFYRTISLMATGAEMHGENFEPGAWQKLFISSLRLVGTVLTAAFTAIFTNYLIRANLGGALAIRRIPDGGHIIVCGLGNVGFRAVEELHGQGESVVVIERRADNAFIPTARRLGVPVIIGDAAIAEVLRQAHAATALAVVAASSDDLINLEIALLVRDLAPRQRVVMRLTDPNLAHSAGAVDPRIGRPRIRGPTAGRPCPRPLLRRRQAAARLRRPRADDRLHAGRPADRRVRRRPPFRPRRPRRRRRHHPYARTADLPRRRRPAHRGPVADRLAVPAAARSSRHHGDRLELDLSADYTDFRRFKFVFQIQC